MSCCVRFYLVDWKARTESKFDVKSGQEKLKTMKCFLKRKLMASVSLESITISSQCFDRSIDN